MIWIVDIGGMPFPLAKICANELWLPALADTAWGAKAESTIAKLYPHRRSFTLARAYAFA